MATRNAGHHKHGGTTGQRTHSKERVVDERAFERLVEATYRMDDDYHSLESRFVLFAAGRYGLRAGEIVHFREEWVDWRRGYIEVPYHQPCRKGRDGGTCGYCRQSAEQRAAHNDDVTLEQAVAATWSPKTEAAAREIPLEANTRARMALEAYCDRFDAFQASRSAVNRRVNWMCELAENVAADATTPHGLRATAATYYASRGLDVLALQSMMGWADLQTAHCYIRSTGEHTSRALRDIQR